MFRNYLKTAIRNLLRYKGFSIINIASLTLGIIGCLVIGLFVWDEQKFDQHIPGKENIFRIYEERKDANATTYPAVVSPMYATFTKQQYPEVEVSARMMMMSDKFLMEVGETRGYEEKGRFVDSSFFKVFPLKFLHGDGVKALEGPNSIVLSEDIANRYFGKADPIGKIVSIDKDSFEVKGVFAQLPKHFHLEFNYLMPITAMGLPPERMSSWGWHQFYTYIKLKPGTDFKNVQKKLQAHIIKEQHPEQLQSGSTFLPFLQPLEDIYLKSADFVYDIALRGNADYVRGLTIIALFVLVIACFNFINLATARSFRRAKEIGVRKVVGADRRQLIYQFIGETAMLSLISMILASLITWLIVPALNNFTGKAIEFNPFLNPALGFLLLLSGLLIGVIAGIYPALVLSGFQPIKVLKNMKPGGGGNSWLRPALVVVQFSLSVLLIVSTIIVYRQTKYLNTKELGFEKEQLIYFTVREGALEKVETFKTELKKSPGVVSVTSGYGLPGDAFAGETIIIPGPDGEKKHPSNNFIGDHDYVKTLGLQLVAGRDFSKEMSTDVREAFLINETAVREFGFGTAEKALGKPIHWEEWIPVDTLDKVKRGRVIGVVKDFHYKSLHEKVTPSIIQLYPAITSKVAVKLRTENLDNSLASIQAVWNKFSPGFPLDYKFMDETYGKMYETEQKLSDLLWIFAIMAILVGCMGLFGLAAFSAEQRKKEIGIRRVLGAGILNIVGLLSRNFILLVLIASLVAFPLAYWAMNNWLQDFTYRISIEWWVFALALLAALGVALITVSFQSIRAATMNPVKSLRTE